MQIFVTTTKSNTKTAIKIIDTLKKLGHTTVLARHDKESEYESSDKKAVLACDMLVADATETSQKQAYEIALALENTIPVAILYDTTENLKLLNIFPISKSIDVLKCTQIIPYTEDTLASDLANGVRELASTAELRISLNLPRVVSKYLDKVSTAKGISRADYLKNLIEMEMKKRK
jgi:energy-coupling factor transporter ATP-binding protein EcfA2